MHQQYQRIHDEVSKRVGHHIEPTSKMSNDRKSKGPTEALKNTTNSTNDDLESEEDFNREKSQLFFCLFFRQNSTFNMTHFMEQSKKRAKAIAEAMDYKKFNNWKHQLMDNLQEDESSLRFVLTTIICIGSFLNVIYMSYGLAGLPILLLKGHNDLEPGTEQHQGSIQNVRDQLRIIQEKYHQRKRHHISAADKAKYKMYKRQEKVLAMQENGSRSAQYE